MRGEDQPYLKTDYKLMMMMRVLKWGEPEFSNREISLTSQSIELERYISLKRTSKMPLIV